MAFKAHHEISVDCSKIEEFDFEDVSSDKKLSHKTLMEESKPKVMGQKSLKEGVCQIFFLPTEIRSE